MFYIAFQILSNMVKKEKYMMFPNIENLTKISQTIAFEIIKDQEPQWRGKEIKQKISDYTWKLEYPTLERPINK